MLRLDADGDIYRSNGRMHLLNELEDPSSCTKQRIEVGLRWRKGEYEFNTLLGMPWDDLSQKGVPMSKIRAAITRRIVSEPGILSVIDMQISATDRGVTATGRAKLVTGQVVDFNS